MGHERLNVVEKRRRHVHVQHALLQPAQALDGCDRGERVHQIAAVPAAQQFALRGGGWITQVHAHQESIQLRFGQRVSADLVLRVLGGDDEKWFGKRHRLSVEGYLMLFHGLEQRALSLGRGTIDFVGQHQLCKYGPALKSELAGLTLEDRYAEHVGGQEVAGELYPLKRQPQRLGNGVGERGLADPRNVFDQQVHARQQAGQAQTDLHFLAQYGAVDLSENGIDLGLRGVHWSLSAVTRAIWAAS